MGSLLLRAFVRSFLANTFQQVCRLLRTNSSCNGCGMATCGTCGHRERKSETLLREIASAAVLRTPGTCFAMN